MHDEAPCHRSKVVSKYFWKNKVEVLDWPGNNSDLNLLKNLWTYIKNKTAENQPFSAKALVIKIKKALVKKISTEYCVSLVKSMPSHLAAIMRKNGGHTIY